MNSKKIRLELLTISVETPGLVVIVYNCVVFVIAQQTRVRVLGLHVLSVCALLEGDMY